MRSYIHSSVASNFSNSKSPPRHPIQLSSILDSYGSSTEPSNLFCKQKPNFAFSSKVICLLFGSLTMGFGNFPDLGDARGCGQDFSALKAWIGTGGLNTMAGEDTELDFLAMGICLGAPGSTICSLGSQVICCGATALVSSAS